MDGVSQLLTRVSIARHERSRALSTIEQTHAPRFNPLELLVPGEMALSSVLRWMLDDKESHGQGDVFRRLFFDRVIQNCDVDWEGASVRCEVQTSDRLGRIDVLLVSRDGHHSLVLENKPWAGWQEDQLARYRVDQRHRASTRVHALIGGTANAQAALLEHWRMNRRVAAGEPLPDAVTASSFTDVIAWLSACARRAQPDRVRVFLLQLADYCRTAILSEPIMSDTTQTADLILAGGASAIAAAQEIAAALPTLTSRMTAQVASWVDGHATVIGRSPAIRFVAGEVPLAMVLFGAGVRPWIGVTDEQATPALKGRVSWGRPELIWLKWTHFEELGDTGEAMLGGIAAFDRETISATLPRCVALILGTA